MISNGCIAAFLAGFFDDCYDGVFLFHLNIIVAHRFMQTELELHDEIVEMRAIATQPEIYPLLLASETGALRTILTLINHDNTGCLAIEQTIAKIMEIFKFFVYSDISVAVIELLHELSDVDTLNESTEGAKMLVDELSEFRVVSVLVQNMDRLDEANNKEVDTASIIF